MRAFTEHDLLQVNEWMKMRGLAVLVRSSLPRFGMIEDSVACGFLCQTDTTTSFLEGFITNPEAPSEMRHRALNKIAQWAVNLSTVCGYKRCIAISGDESIVERAENLGFKKQDGCVVTVLDIGG